MGRPPRAGVWVSVHQPGIYRHFVSLFSSCDPLVAKEQLLLSILSHAIGCGSENFFLYHSSSDALSRR